MTASAPKESPGRRLDPARVFLILAPILYLAYALLTPPFQTPDEHQHLFRAYQLAGGHILGERHDREAGGYLPPGLVRSAQLELGNAAPHVLNRPTPKTSLAERFDRATPLNADDRPQFTNFQGSVSYTPAGYVPQILAVWVGRVLDLSVETIVRLGRILNAGLALALLYVAFRALPVGRLLLLLIALFPMTAACAASLGQDGMIIGAGALLTALGLRAVVLGRWTRREAVAATVMTCLITLAKAVYLPLAGLALLPRPSGAEFWRWALPPVMFGVVALVLSAMWLKLVSGLFVPMLAGMPSPAEQLAHLAEHPLLFPRVLIATYAAHSKPLFESAFIFGWLNIGPVWSAVNPTLAALAVTLWNGDERADLLSRTWRVWALVVSLVTIVLLTLALYILGSNLGGTIVEGLQGRYFIPIVLPFLLPLLRRRLGDPTLPILIVTILSGVANVLVLQEIWRAFYV